MPCRRIEFLQERFPDERGDRDRAVRRIVATFDLAGHQHVATHRPGARRFQVLHRGIRARGKVVVGAIATIARLLPRPVVAAGLSPAISVAATSLSIASA